MQKASMQCVGRYHFLKQLQLTVNKAQRFVWTTMTLWMEFHLSIYTKVNSHLKINCTILQVNYSKKSTNFNIKLFKIIYLKGFILGRGNHFSDLKNKLFWANFPKNSCCNGCEIVGSILQGNFDSLMQMVSTIVFNNKTPRKIVENVKTSQEDFSFQTCKLLL